MNPIGIVSYSNNASIQSYVHWLERAGALPVVIESAHFDLNTVRGVVWVGGTIETMSVSKRRAFFAALHKTFRHAVRQNNRGIPFPIWGTCLGFQLLATLRSGHLSAVENYSSQTVKFLPSEMKNAVARLSLKATFRHHYSLRPPYPVYLEPTSESRDSKGPYLTSFQFKKYPFYGVLWHPETPSPGGEQFSRQLALFLLQQTKK